MLPSCSNSLAAKILRSRSELFFFESHPIDYCFYNRHREIILMESKERTKQASKVTFLGFIVNLFLTIIKILAGVFGKSGAMFADGIHSLSDLATDIVVIVFIGIAGKEKDRNHRYGHGKFETFATMLISFVLLFVGIGILYDGSEKIINSILGEAIEQPAMIALYAAFLSILLKEALYWHTLFVGKKINSKTVIANAWHHRTDAFSSIGTALGIAGAIYLGEQWRILDPLAGIVVSIFILKVAWQLGKPSIMELLETSLPEHTEREIIDIIESVDGVRSQHNLKTRNIGIVHAVEIHVKVDKHLSVEQSHDIATDIEVALRNRFGEETHVAVHLEPFYEKNKDTNC